MKPESFNLRIEELVLRGFAPGDRYRIGEAVEQEFARLVEENGAPSLLTRSAELADLSGVSFQIAQGSKPQTIGAQIAQAVYGELNK